MLPFTANQGATVNRKICVAIEKNGRKGAVALQNIELKNLQFSLAMSMSGAPKSVKHETLRFVGSYSAPLGLD